MQKVIIIGGGASGIVAAIKAKRENNQVIVLERNSVSLKKLLMTGNGKCNYLNEVYHKEFYHSQSPELIDEVISPRNVTLAKNLFEDLGVVGKIKNGYYYPFSNQATTIKNALLFEATNLGVEFVYDCRVMDVSKKDKFSIITDQGKFTSDIVVFAMGGCSYSKTGSDGFGYELLEKMGHQIIKPLPALVQLESNFKYRKEWNGIRTDVELNLFEDGQFLSKEKGEVQLTDYGISGICTFNLSHFVSRGLDCGKKEVIKINFIPFVETLITPWMHQFALKNQTKKLGELLEGILNYKLIPIILKTVGVSSESYYAELSKEEKLKLCKYLRAFPIEITGTKGFDAAQVSNGGVSLEEINLKTMESLKVKGLYIIGELLDLTGNCGGYNLTECWITGMLAGKDIGDLCD